MVGIQDSGPCQESASAHDGTFSDLDVQDLMHRLDAVAVQEHMARVPRKLLRLHVGDRQLGHPAASKGSVLHVTPAAHSVLWLSRRPQNVALYILHRPV